MKAKRVTTMMKMTILRAYGSSSWIKIFHGCVLQISPTCSIKLLHEYQLYNKRRMWNSLNYLKSKIGQASLWGFAVIAQSRKIICIVLLYQSCHLITNSLTLLRLEWCHSSWKWGRLLDDLGRYWKLLTVVHGYHMPWQCRQLVTTELLFSLRGINLKLVEILKLKFGQELLMNLCSPLLWCFRKRTQPLGPLALFVSDSDVCSKYRII